MSEPPKDAANSVSSPVGDSVSFMAFMGSAKRAQPAGFEGPEKRMEVIVRRKPGAPENGLRAAPQSTWEEIISVLNAKIVDTVSNEYLDSYVLTESSLFVFPHRCILITCGTTVLLDALARVLALVEQLQCEVEWASFMRKDFSYPWEQVGPHASMEAEYATLKAQLPLGRPFIFGPIDSDHYFVFVYDDIKRPCVEDDLQLSMTMYDFDPAVAKTFYSDTFIGKDGTGPIREASGVERLVKGWVAQDLQFAPCGYSINAILEGAYQTMHITPEEHCSFASYETNSRLETVDERLQLVLQVFKPKRFSVMILADPQSPVGELLAKNTSIGLDKIQGYTSSNQTINEFAPGYTVVNVNFSRVAGAAE